MKKSYIILLLCGIVVACLLFTGFVAAMKKALKAKPGVKDPASYYRGLDQKRRTQDIQEQQKRLRDDQEQRMDDYRLRQEIDSSYRIESQKDRVESSLELQRRYMQEQKQKMKDSRRRSSNQ